ncbi:hypothetical protein KY290_001288 [Solanum tuberosum]|uniref:Uncharacterized protein n=1 Tax=Solanum tuberosum TaxID=4113 RepID=A0ABQ7WLV1_SOLTU|nr:hypothetical protein KY290_001288 [Solanum tuberosum]
MEYSQVDGTYFHTGAAWLSSARVMRCLVKSYNVRNPYFVLLRHAPKEKVFATETGHVISLPKSYCRTEDPEQEEAKMPDLETTELEEIAHDDFMGNNAEEGVVK